MRTIHSFALVLAAGMLAACGGGGSSGQVSLTQGSLGGVSTTVLSASFVDLPLSELLAGNFPGCTRVAQQGSCFALSCQAGTTLEMRAAGTLSASVAGADVLTAMQGSGGGYSATATSTLFSSGQTIGLRASGGGVPAFTGMVTAPEELVATVPATIARAADLTVSWPASTAAEQVTLAIIPTTGSRVAVTCTVPAGDGQVVVASSVLTQLMAGSTALVTLGGFNSTQVTAGAFTVRLVAAQSVITSATVN